ncbi:MAG: hypothetical protein A2104_05230 [Candidatus Melainabacteria bacterium GWF2_32_7]|nr:MAG: hypothetical protein A2104_05230 [Candidatus Melainabacteria bacterium GWF2_32_7]
MHKIKLRGIILPLVIIILGAVLSIIVTLIPKLVITIKVPLLLTGVFAASSAINFLLFKKASANQVVGLSFANTILFIIITLSSLFCLDIIGIREINFSSNLNINPFLIIINLLTSTLTLCALIKLEENKVNKKYIPAITNESPINIQENNSKENETEIISIKNALQNAELTSYTAKKSDEQTFNDDSSDKNNETASEESFLEDAIIPDSTNNTFNNKYTGQSLNSNLGNLPEISLEKNTTEYKDEKISQNMYNTSIFENQDQFIPENVRLVEKAAPKKVGETSAHISSIGKLLVNYKDIENIIELNEFSQSENEADNANIIPKELGEKLKEILTQIEKEFPQIKNSTISNKAGFTIASLINDNRAEQTIGALASGAFMTSQNYLSRLNIGQPLKIFFETQVDIHILIKVENFIFYFNCNKEFEPINHSLLRDTIEQNVFSNQDLSVIKNIKGITEAAITDKDGNLIGSINSENPQKMASITSAIFENLKVFISNIQPAKLNKMIIFASEKIITIKKYNDAIASLSSTLEGPITTSEKIIKIEGLIK